MALCWRWLLNTHTSHIEFTCFYNYQSSALQVAAFPLNPTTAILLCFKFLVRLILWLFTRSLVSTAEINLLNHNVKSTHKKHELMKAEEASRQSDVTRLDFLFNETSRAPHFQARSRALRSVSLFRTKSWIFELNLWQVHRISKICPWASFYDFIYEVTILRLCSHSIDLAHEKVI